MAIPPGCFRGLIVSLLLPSRDLARIHSATGGSIAVRRLGCGSGYKHLNAKRLIVNADGFGFGPGATQGIFDVLSGGGPVTSVSVNVNFTEAERCRELVERFPAVSVGLHLNPIVGTPCLSPEKIPSLVGSDGCFHGEGFYPRWRARRISLSELEAELDAQVARLRLLVGDHFTHVDSQENSHLLYFPLFLRVARRGGIRCMRTNAVRIGLEHQSPVLARVLAYLRRPQALVAHAYRRLQMRRARRAKMRMADRLVIVGYARVGNKAVAENWERILRNLPRGTYEIYCHPAYPDPVLRRWSTAYSEPRRQELEILRSRRLRHFAEAEGVSLISFFDLLRG